MSHVPKQRALELYAEDLLSAVGSARLEAHLAQCEVCRGTLDAIRAYRELCAASLEQRTPELAWARLERALDDKRAPALDNKLAPALDAPVARPRDVQRSRTGRVIALAWPVLAVAVTGLIAWLGTSTAPEDGPRAAQHDPRHAALDASPGSEARIGHVTLIAGDVRVLGAVSSLPDNDPEGLAVTIRSEIVEGQVLVTKPGAELHVALDDDTGSVLAEPSRLRVVELRAGRTRLELLSGDLDNQVHTLAEGEQYRVATSDIVANVRGTRFRVAQHEGTFVSVEEGQVEISRGNTTVAMLSPGQSFEEPPRPHPAHHIQVHALGQSLDTLRTLSLPASDLVKSWRVDGASIGSEGALSMRLPAARAQLSFEDLRGQIRSVDIELDQLETSLDELQLAKLLAPREQRVGHLEPEQIAKIVRAGLDPLRRCYQRSLRTSPEAQGKFTLAMRVAADGHVARAELEDAAGLPRELSQCISNEARRWSFPRPEGNGPVAFEVPLNLKSSD